MNTRSEAHTLLIGEAVAKFEPKRKLCHCFPCLGCRLMQLYSKDDKILQYQEGSDFTRECLQETAERLPLPPLTPDL